MPHPSVSTDVICCVADEGMFPNRLRFENGVAVYFAGAVTSNVKYVLGQK